MTYLYEYALCPIYDRISSLYPTSWSPNAVTLMGIFATTLSSLLLLTAMPPDTVFEPPYPTFIPASLTSQIKQHGASSTAPSPLYITELQPYLSSIFTAESLLFVCGLLNLIYCVADNTDGRLARRLQKVSSTGEYLDHGLDCVTSLMSTCVSMSVLGFSFSNIAVTVSLVALGTVMSHTLHYEENIFIWGSRYFSVDEAMVFFFLASWVALLFPNIGTATIPSYILYTVLPENVATLLLPLRCIDAALMCCWVAQLQVIVSILVKSWRVLFRLSSLALLLNIVFFMFSISYHSTNKYGISGCSFGPLSYVSLWIITMSFSSSIIVHIPVFAHCEKLSEANPLPLAGTLLICLVFICCPTGGMLLAVAWHVGQIYSNLGQLVAPSRFHVL
ncbi:putative CDP alcohol phosphatidyltransferase [Trypanosoma vivax]|nr:putative CDP alcohol phosphatidyltransferase [Trypanosoma vivax]